MDKVHDLRKYMSKLNYLSPPPLSMNAAAIAVWTIVLLTGSGVMVAVAGVGNWVPAVRSGMFLLLVQCIDFVDTEQQKINLPMSFTQNSASISAYLGILKPSSLGAKW